MSGAIKKLLLLPHLQVHNANALSSPYTIGFPAVTGFLGAVHAMQRQIQELGFTCTFEATGIISHTMDLQTYRGANDFVSSIIGTGNPLDKTGSRSPFIEEARCHLDISLLIELQSLNKDDEKSFLDAISQLLHRRIRIAGGVIQQFHTPEIRVVANEQDMKSLQRKLMPGYVLIERRDLMIESMQQGQDATDALLDYLTIHHHSNQDDDGKVRWTSQRKSRPDQAPGWIVPIATGFHGISDLDTAKNQRDPEVPHRFAESVVTLGEFKMPYRLHSLEDMLWRYHYNTGSNLYLCQQGRMHDVAVAAGVSTQPDNHLIYDEFGEY
ncbi:type I-F CRISPR-associated protein Csy2 [Endozoicomonas sp. (ex Bugula neritina AB1)]|nr:type I-F CRISPR-associated protein Csy2 [Endozoicomonas sp. (ex Bugula neritina AB1)]